MEQKSEERKQNSKCLNCIPYSILNQRKSDMKREGMRKNLVNKDGKNASSFVFNGLFICVIFLLVFMLSIAK